MCGGNQSNTYIIFYCVYMEKREKGKGDPKDISANNFIGEI